MEQQVYIRATSGFFVQRRGIVNPGETVLLMKGEAQDVVAAERGQKITQQEYNEGPKADFKPKDSDGKVIPEVNITRAQQHANFREQMKRASDPASAEQAARIANGINSRQNAGKSAGVGA